MYICFHFHTFPFYKVFTDLSIIDFSLVLLYLYIMPTKQKVFEILSASKGSYVSGEKLAQECGVSRAAIWKAVKAIRDDGFLIEGTNNN